MNTGYRYKKTKIQQTALKYCSAIGQFKFELSNQMLRLYKWIVCVWINQSNQALETGSHCQLNKNQWTLIQIETMETALQNKTNEGNSENVTRIKIAH